MPITQRAEKRSRRDVERDVGEVRSRVRDGVVIPRQQEVRGTAGGGGDVAGDVAGVDDGGPTRSSVLIDGPGAAVVAVVADFASYPAWASEVLRAEVIESGGDGRASTVGF